MKLTLIQDDLITLNVDAIVNAANTSLLGGGGADGAIHQAAGPELLEACKRLNGCKVGQVKITKGYHLSAHYILHTVGPIWHGGNHGEAEHLAECYRNTLLLAAKHRLKTIAFPAISCGAYGFPAQLACDISVSAVMETLVELPDIRKVIFCAHSDLIHQAWLNSFQEIQYH